MKRLISIALCFLMVLALCPSVFAEENVCEIGDTGYLTLDAALTAVQSEETIKLLKNIDYNSGIVIVNKSVTFDLNGFNLNVVNIAEEYTAEEMSGLYVKGNAVVLLEGEGEFNVTGSWYGVFAECNEGESAEVTVTNATGVGRDGVAAQSSKVTVKGDATSSGSTYSGVWASYENAEVIVEGNVYANGEMSMGVNTDTLASVTVKGGVIVNGNNSIGVKAGYDGDVTVEGDVAVSGSGAIGVSLLSVEKKPSIVTVKGVIEAEKYILFEAEEGSGEEYSFQNGFWDEKTGDYIYYTKDSKSFVYVSMFAGGSGTVEDPYLIAHATQLYNISMSCDYYYTKHYKQIADIDLGDYFSLGEGWGPIGNGEVPFVGSYDGDGHTINKLFINRPYQGYIGLFAVIGHGAEIRNVGLINADVTGHHDVGGLAAVNYGLIINSYVIGKVSGTTNAGGLISYNEGSVTDSYFDGTVSHVKRYDTDNVEYAGGLVGYNSKKGSITDCYAKATVESEWPYIGGLAGGNLGSITDSHAISAVTGYYCVGGLTGYNDGIINNSYADGNVTGASQAGGLVGLHESPHPITNSYFTGTVTAPDGYTGGLVGYNLGGSISNCRADATVTSAGEYVGGLVGGSIGLITGSWSAGAVTGGNHVGGLVGATFNNAGSQGISEISASYSACAVEGEMYVGGLAGSNETPISESYAKGNVTKADEADFTYTHFGGLVGKNTGPIEDSYAWGNVSGHQYVGGLIGYNEANVTNCYEIGAVSGNSNTGGLIGVNFSGANIVGSFWNNNTSGQESSDGGISKGSVQMKQQATYVNEDWDFDTIWGIDTDENDGYPFLIWQVGAEFAGGSGTMEDPYLIAIADQLYNVRNHLDKHFRQTADLDLSGYRSGSGWAPIGTSTNTFTGTYDGDGHTIKRLYIAQVGAWDVRIPAGLFGYTGAEAEICNLTLKDVDVTGCYYVGSLVGNNNGKITDVSVSGNVTGEWDTGGLVGRNNGSLIGSCFMGDVTGTKKIEYGDWTGGLVGYNLGAITNCWATATVVSEGESVGGLVGENLPAGIINGSCSAGTVTANKYTGGLTGANSGEITECYSLCTVNGDLDVGGLVGGNSGPITDSFAAGAVAGTNRIGGLVGSSTGATVTGCYWDTEASGKSTSAGGTGKTTEEMKEQATYENWNFITIWDINTSFNDGYPFLRWQGYEAEPTTPSAPQNFTAAPGDGQVELRWSAPASDGGAVIIRYEVSNDNGGTWVTAVTNTSHTFTDLTNGAAYTFKVRAVNSVGNGAEASVSATPVAYMVTINGSYAATTGAGSYAQGTTVTINAGSRSSYTFAGWTSPDGVTFMNANNATNTFIMPDKNVTITANWRYNGGGGSSGTPTTPVAPVAPVYKADVKEESGAETTIPVTVDKDVGTASVDAYSQGLDQGGTNITIPSIPDVDTYSVGIPVPDLSTSDGQGTLTVNTDAGNVTVPSNMLTGVSGISGSKAEIAIGQGDKNNLPDTVKAAIGDRPLVQLSLSIDGKQTDWSNPGAPVTVSISYTPTAAELANPESIVVWYIDGSGNVVTIPNGYYNPGTGMVTFDITHFSDYAVAYNKVSFNDVTAGAWYHKAVSFIAARGITGGTGNGYYSPEVKLTRGQFIVMLMKAYGIAPDADPKNNFADAGATYYTGYLAAAKRLSISNGVGNNMFAPEKEITRQEMFTLLYNALKIIGQLPQGDSGKTLDHFFDAGQIDSWAKEAMTLMVKTGTIGGNAEKLNPISTTTRAEMAQVLYNLLSK